MTANEFRKMAPVPGGWGRKGSTHVQLRTARKAAVREALSVAYQNRASK